jgi:GNAT superfamily N-acetyltransferase
MSSNRATEVTVRHDLQPGDLGYITALHGILYATEYGFDHRFEAYVAETLAEFGQNLRPQQDRLWIAELAGRPVGSIGIVGRQPNTAQLRWLVLHPAARGRSLGRRLVEEALSFCRTAGYHSVFLWTVDILIAAARLYQSVGFTKTEDKPAALLWGQTLIEQRYDLTL